MYTCTRTHTCEVEDVYPEQQGGGAVVAEQRRRLCCLWNGAETVQCSGVEGACVCVVCVSLATPTSMERERVWYLTATLVECNQHMPLCTWLVGKQIMH